MTHLRGRLEMDIQCYFDALPNVFFGKGGEKVGGCCVKKEEKKKRKKEDFMLQIDACTA